MAVRLILVAWLFVLFTGGAYYYSDALFATLQKVWSLNKDDLEKFKTLLEITAMLVTAVAALVTAVWAFIAAKKPPHPAGATPGNNAVFHGKVKIGGDVVQGNKTTITPHHGDRHV